MERAQAAWRELNPADPIASWTAQVRPHIVATVEQAQAEAASLAPLYTAATLAAAGSVSAPLGRLVAAAFAGYATTGLTIAALMDFALRAYRRALALDMPPSEAHARGLSRLLRYVSTEVSDAGRLAVQVAAVTEPAITGYERIVHLPACGRCVQLAGRLYRRSDGFLRHPRCDCSMKPVTAEQWRTARLENHPRALFERMTRAQQDKSFGQGDAAAIRAGADVSRVVNTRRRGAVYVAGGHEYTHEATTVRGIGRQLGEVHTQPGHRYRRSGIARPTAAQLVNIARDDNELLDQLRRFGYLR